MNRPFRLATLALLLVLLAAAQPSGVSVAAASGPQPYCGIRWGSLPKNHLFSTYTTATVENLRAGRHACFDRLVVDLGPVRSGLPGRQGNGYQVRYVPEVHEASGRPLAIRGGAILAIVVNAPAHDEAYLPTFDPSDRLNAVNVTGFPTFRQVAFLGSFESQTEVAVGVRARLPFRVFVLAGPDGGSRLVIDVAHRW
jgi:hypothetical protein